MIQTFLQLPWWWQVFAGLIVLFVGLPIYVGLLAVFMCKLGKWMAKYLYDSVDDL